MSTSSTGLGVPEPFLFSSVFSKAASPYPIPVPFHSLAPLLILDDILTGGPGVLQTGVEEEHREAEYGF